MRLPTKPPHSSKHTEERLKLLATGLQNLALALFVGIVIAPVFNASIVAPGLWQVAAFVAAGVAEGVAIILLRYIPPPVT